jgi:MoaA/NifB/PqqE/SkfB family radical SAM enzyme
MLPRMDSTADKLHHFARRAFTQPALAAKYFVAQRHAPLLAQVVVTRRCNLKCAYCNEFDRVSQPVPLQRLRQTVDHLAALGTRAVAFTGGEPTLHPDLVALVRHTADRIAKVSMSSNGYKLTPDLVDALSDAGLGRMQISLDGIEPNEVTAKVFRCTERKLAILAERARFVVHINAVLGSIPFEETLEIVERARDWGFETTVQWLHDERGQAMNPHGITEAQVRQLLAACALPAHHGADVLGAGLDSAPPFRCRAGSRYLYVDEFSNAHFCSQALDLWSQPIDEVTPVTLRTNFHTPKACAARCTLGCVRDASRYDAWRPQRGQVVG